MFIQLKKIRNSLLRDDRFAKYILYAIGEIFLVVTGILIALQVNNYNLKRQVKVVELNYYQTMKTQLMEDKELLKGEIHALSNRMEDYLSGASLIGGNDRKHAEKLGKDVYRLLEYGDFRRKSSVYQSLVYSGEIKHIKNKKIIENLQELERTYDITERLEGTQAEVVMIHSAPLINIILDFETRKITAPDLVFTTAFKNRFYLAIRLVKEKKDFFEHALSVIDDTLKDINSELKGSSNK